jgi:hypothetical protein
MAQEQQGQQNQPQQPGTTNTFTGGMVKDPIDLFKKNDTYTHARNMTNMLADGQLYGKSAEPANITSVSVPYTPIGFIYLSDDQWLVFSTDNTTSEIGLFDDANNTYSTLMNDAATLAAGKPGLNFKTSNLITGAARRGYDCGFDAYWSDGNLNPDRTLNTATCPWTIGSITTPKTFPNPWVQSCIVSAGCYICHNTDVIDIEQLRLAPIISTPCLKVTKHAGLGQLLNGTYQVCMAYAINSIKCTDYVAFSDVISLWRHLSTGNAFDLHINGIDSDTKVRFTEMEIVVISMVNQQVQAKRLGIYSTNLEKITIDNIDATLPNIPLEKLPISSPAIVSSDAIYSISNYLTRVGPKERPDFNYQILANNIQTWWVAVEYDEDYYHLGGDENGMNVSFLRGEVYSYYIRFEYNTGDKSASYHIPARSTSSTGSPTVTLGPPPAYLAPAGQLGGRAIAYGRTGVYTSNERYPDRSPAVWGPLCGKPIMHHQFPDQTTPAYGTTILSHFNPNGAPALGQKNTISVMGVFFSNIASPVDNNGNLIPDIVGYEILRSTRDGHESIVAKGMINNMRTYSSQDNGVKDGLFQNYPYNEIPDRTATPPRLDWFLTNKYANVEKGTTGNGANSQLEGHRDDILSFHSPDTTFNHPYLGAGQLELVMAMGGVSKGIFIPPYKHPMFKVLSNFTNWFTLFVDSVYFSIQAGQIASMFVGGQAPDLKVRGTESLPFNAPLLVTVPTPDQISGTTMTPSPGSVAAGIANLLIMTLLDFITLPAFNEQILSVIKGLIPPRQYAMQYNSFGNYDIPINTGGIVPFPIEDYQYVKGQVQSFSGYTINNLYRNDYVVLKLNQNIPTRKNDRSRYNLGPNGSAPINKWHTSHQLQNAPVTNNTIDSYYAVYRTPQSSQYGQVDSTKQVPIGCVQKITPSATQFYTSPVLFGGDTYINRYTEKNPFMFFNDWLVDAPEDFKYDYRDYINVPYPMFWINNDVINYTLIDFASDNRRLDGPINVPTFSFGPPPKINGLFYVNTGYFYLFYNGCRNFFVESSVNVGYREWEEPIAKRFYDPYASSDDFINQYFRADIIKSDIFYKYDYSLSANKFINQFISWGSCLRRDYDPNLAYTCFSYYPRRVAYSLPQEEEQMQDNWKIFLPNNYKDFNDRVSVIKDLHKTGALFLMESSSPMMFAGVETIATHSKTEYTIGTGALFNQSLQSILNVDDSYEYASCQSKLGVINTPHGAFWVSQKTGKLINLVGGQIVDIGEHAGLKYHLLKYLPSQLLQQFPNYPLQDNPVAGVGVQLIYDSVHQILYICKKDYKAVNPALTSYVGNNFVYNDARVGRPIKVSLEDPIYFDSACWTLSYDCVKKEFISWHDWHPSLAVPSKNHFSTTHSTSGQLWRHNSTVQSFANFYGQNYPVEIEYFTNTQVNESIIQSVEWLLESYQYAPNGVDKFLNYDQSFDYLMVYNKEQNSTLQNMLLKPWNNPYAAVNYPNWIGSTRQILYQKVENKYRVNDFYDYTADRGQFTLANTPMMTTNPDGYTFSTNTGYFNLLKPWNQQKRIRYTGTRIFMRKTNLGKNSLTIRYASTKNQYSAR